MEADPWGRAPAWGGRGGGWRPALGISGWSPRGQAGPGVRTPSCGQSEPGGLRLEMGAGRPSQLGRGPEAPGGGLEAEPSEQGPPVVGAEGLAFRGEGGSGRRCAALHIVQGE